MLLRMQLRKIRSLVIKKTGKMFLRIDSSTGSSFIRFPLFRTECEKCFIFVDHWENESDKLATGGLEMSSYDSFAADERYTVYYCAIDHSIL